MAKIRYLTVQVQNDDELENFRVFREFGLNVHIRDSGCADGKGAYYNIVVSNEVLDKKLVRQIFKEPPGEYEWDNTEHDIK